MFHKLRSWLKNSRRKSILALATAVILAAGGTATIGIALTTQLKGVPFVPPSSQTTRVISPTKTFSKNNTKSDNQAMTYSVPISLDIPEISVSKQLIQVGKNSDGSVQVPAEPTFDSPAWYKYSPAPGQTGASVILGHVDNYQGISVFWNLAKLKPGDLIKVSRSDNSTAIFTIDMVHQYPKADFPTEAVYGPSDKNDAELRVITCGGYNSSTRNWDNNTVVFATLSARQPA